MTNNSKSTDLRTDQALDKLLDMAAPVPPSPDLKARIMAAAIGGNNQQTETARADVGAGAGAGAGAEIISFAKAKNAKLSKPSNSRSPLRFGGNWAAAGLMAASLVIGIWTGTAGYADNLINAPLELAGLQDPVSTDDLSIYGLIDELPKDGNLL